MTSRSPSLWLQILLFHILKAISNESLTKLHKSISQNECFQLHYEDKLTRIEDKWTSNLNGSINFQRSGHSSFQKLQKVIQELETYLYQQLHGGMDFGDFNYMVQLHFGEKFTP